MTHNFIVILYRNFKFFVTAKLTLKSPSFQFNNFQIQTPRKRIIQRSLLSAIEPIVNE